MAILKRPRHEKFAQEVARSPKTRLSQGKCYTNAGFNTEGRSADACAARLLADANVQARVSEILAPAVRRTRVTVESLLTELETTIGDARAAKQHTVVVQALGLSAKLVGLLRDKIEVGGPGDFDRTADDVLERIIDELGGGDPAVALEAMDRMHAEMRVELEARAAARATAVAGIAAGISGHARTNNRDQSVA